jgi:hypothetical protein
MEVAVVTAKHHAQRIDLHRQAALAFLFSEV